MVSETPRQCHQRLQQLFTKAGVEDAGFDASVLLEQVAGKNWRWQEEPLTQPQTEALAAMAQRRAGREPLQYILGSWSFLDFELKIGEGVLIPRADTELLCETAAELLQGELAPAVLDLCAGSGCVGLGIKRFVPAASLTALEKSPKAFSFLQHNLQYALAGQSAAGVAVLGDVFGFEATRKADSLALIASNPPYITAAEMQTLAPELAFEPSMALHAEEEGLLFYRYIAPHYLAALRPLGWLCFEIGSTQAQAVMQILADAGYQNIACKQDLAGLDRVIIGQKPEKLER